MEPVKVISQDDQTLPIPSPRLLEKKEIFYVQDHISAMNLNPEATHRVIIESLETPSIIEAIGFCKVKRLHVRILFSRYTLQ